uniref:Uncharacterized protein n=1 Tax=Cacopsylla melanoneura TaxID=428564 RepID=A0A8D9BGD2_9HEMI
MNKSRAVSQENKLTQTKGSEIDRALAKAGDSGHAQNSGTKNNRLKMKGKTTYNLNVNRGEYKRRPIFKMNTNKEPRMKRESTIAIENMLAECATEIYKGKTHSKMNTERKSKLKRNQSSDSVQDAAHSATEHSGDEKSGPVSKNNKPKKNLFVRFMNFGQQWSRLSNNISYTEPKKTLRELRKSRKKCRKKVSNKPSK